MSNLNEVIFNLQSQIKDLEIKMEERMEQEEIKHKKAIEEIMLILEREENKY